jgi:hypothetical protein
MAKNSNKNQCIIEILFFCCAKFVCNMLILNNVFEGVKPRLRLRSSGANPTKHSIVEPMARWRRDNNVRTTHGIHPSEGYLYAHVLGGKHWEVPD